MNVVITLRDSERFDGHRPYDRPHISACGAGEGNTRGAAKHILMLEMC